MDFNEYQEKAKKYDFFEPENSLTSPGFIEKILGLTGEAGETADKIKKIIRDKGGIASKDDKSAIMKELGDTLWYLATLARYLGIPLSDVAETNIEKLESRVQRGTMHGEGDNR